MQSKMTEREFRERIAASDREAAYLDNAVRVAREAGLEFAPEPVKLPERLRVTPNGAYLAYGDGDRPFLAIIDEFGSWDRAFADQTIIQATMTEAVARYNAHPGLRAAAEQLLFAIRDRLHPERQNYLAPQTLKLEDELAKGPK